jgi:hypothetical protein
MPIKYLSALYCNGQSESTSGGRPHSPQPFYFWIRATGTFAGKRRPHMTCRTCLERELVEAFGVGGETLKC